MESDDESLVCCGSPVRPLEDDEIPKKRPISTEDQIVTDEKGRRRFHGAFTGGFSAGYFNSVGTKEGWAPSTFISSRSSRFSQKDQRPEDFMDAEDLGEFGIAHRTIHTTSKFNQQEKPSRKRQLPSQEGPIPGEPPLKDLIIPIKETIGVILLRKLGWRPGQGIGPRVKKKKQRFKGKNSSSLPDEIHSEDLYDEYAEKFDFAPKDVSIANFKPKDNVHGLGYSGLDQNTSVLGNLTSRQQSSVYFVEGKKVQISGQAFGVGVYEDDDEDIYSQEDMSGYHFALEDLPSKSHTSSSSNFSSTGIGVSNQPVPGFLPSSNKVFKIFDKQYFPPPILPKNYQPFHLVKATPLSSDIPTGLNRHSLNSASRSAILEEKQPDSVLNLLSSEDKAKLEKAKLSLTTQKDSFQSKSLDQNNSNSTKSPFSFENFKPFAKNEVKQQKFEEYLKLFLSSDKSDSEHFVKHLPFMLTEWEKKEFQRTALLYKPLAGGIATRFVSAKNTEIVEELEMPKKLQVDKSDQQKAADMKMFGKLTREKVTWYPNKLLCKRFNVPNPHSDSASGRSANAKDEKVSIFNMFTQNTEAKSILSFQSDSKTPHEDLPAKNLKIESPEKDEEVQIVQEIAPEEEEKPTMDLFKAIFESSDDSDDDSDEQTTKPASDKAVKEKSSDKNLVLSSVLSHNTSIASHSIRTSETSPTLKHSSDQSSVKPIASHLHNEAPIEATGLFANLDLDKLKVGFKSNSSKRQTESVTDSSSSNVHLVSAPSTSTDMFYGPKLPPVSPSIAGQNISAEISAKSQFEGSKKKHKEKKHKKHKHKHKSKKSRSRHYSDETLLSRLRQLNSDASHKKKGH